MKKLLWILLIIIIILGLVVLGVYFFNQKNPTVSENLDTTNWKTYSNEEFRYSFKHPPSFSIIQPLAQGYEGGNILVNQGINYLTAYVVTDHIAGLEGRTPDLEINGYKARLASSYGYKTGINIYHNDNLVVIYLRTVDNKIGQNEEDLFMKIVSTIELN